MRIAFVEIQNFRKLKSVRIDFSKDTTVLVGANNSGKTSAMVALNHFLIDQSTFTTNDFTLSGWATINSIGERWEKSGLRENWEVTELAEWSQVLPTLDIWLHAETFELYRVLHLLPSVEWTGGLLGVRLRFEPKLILDLYKEYILARNEAKNTLAEAKRIKQQKNPTASDDYLVSLWPKSMCEFLERRLRMFAIKAYKLDFTKVQGPQNGLARLQALAQDAAPMVDDPFKDLIRIDKIDAHRGFSNLTSRRFSDEEEEDSERMEKGKLSEQLRQYYKKHIDPSKVPDASDVDALEAIHLAQLQFDEKLKTGFKSKFEELEKLGYPGVTDPQLELSTRLKPVDGLNHPSALKFIVSREEKTAVSITLPEYYNGLGYQNLISMVFKLMSFRDHWMQVGKAGKQAHILSSQDKIEPLHMVLVEEPEAHLHVQVQQVFIRRAYDILRNHDSLRNSNLLCTQLIVSTHSSHIAHECDFGQLRYFRRRPAANGEVPISNVINLSEIFGTEDDTAKFVSRYIKATHCDLFFADAAIVVEGAAERMLVPHFIKEHYPELHQSYLSLLEIGGSHAFRFKNLLDHLGLVTLLITDIDSADPAGHHAGRQPKRGENLITSNSTLKKWIPKKEKIDELLTIKGDDKVATTDEFYSVRIAYQLSVPCTLKDGDAPQEAIANSFEDAFVYSNIDLLKGLTTEGVLLKRCCDVVQAATSVEQLNFDIYNLIAANGKLKGEFALDLLFLQDPKSLTIPFYIKEGLDWLHEKIKIKRKDDLNAAITATSTAIKDNGNNTTDGTAN